MQQNFVQQQAPPPPPPPPAATAPAKKYEVVFGHGDNAKPKEMTKAELLRAVQKKALFHAKDDTEKLHVLLLPKNVHISFFQ